MPVKVFCCYAREDEPWLRKLKAHLRLLERQGMLSFWYDRLLVPGSDWSREIDRQLETASVILLLISADFFASDYCFGVEMKRALARQHAGEVRVIPILLRPVDWGVVPFAHLSPLPTDAKPITIWPNEEEALADIAIAIRRVLQELSHLAEGETQAKEVQAYMENAKAKAELVVTRAESSPDHVDGEGAMVAPTSNDSQIITHSFYPEPQVLVPSFRKTISRRTFVIGLTGVAGIGGAFALLHTSFMPGTKQGTLFITYRHTPEVAQVRWSPDGKRIASGSGSDGTVQVWNAADGSQLFTCTGHTGPIMAMGWSPDGKHIVSASQDGTVRIWNATDGMQVFIMSKPYWARAAAWSSDGKRIVSSYDETVQVWNATNGSLFFTYKGHTEPVNTIACSHDGKYIASGSGFDNGSDHTVQVWSAKDGSHVFTFTGHVNVVSEVAWSPDGKRIASGSLDGTVQVWEAL